MHEAPNSHFGGVLDGGASLECGGGMVAGGDFGSSGLVGLGDGGVTGCGQTGGDACGGGGSQACDSGGGGGGGGCSI